MLDHITDEGIVLIIIILIGVLFDHTFFPNSKQKEKALIHEHSLSEGTQPNMGNPYENHSHKHH